MSREHLLVVFGGLVIIAPFAGVPLSWLDIALPALGLGVCVIGVTLVMRKRRTLAVSHEVTSEEAHS